MFVIYNERGEWDDYIKNVMFLVENLDVAKELVETYTKIFSHLDTFYKNEYALFEKEYFDSNTMPKPRTFVDSFGHTAWVSDPKPIRPLPPGHLVGKSKKVKQADPQYPAFQLATKAFDKEMDAYRAKEKVATDIYYAESDAWNKKYSSTRKEFIKTHLDFEKLIPEKFKLSKIFRQHLPDGMVKYYESPSFDFEELSILELKHDSL